MRIGIYSKAVLAISLLVASSEASGPPFSLTDSDPTSQEFRRNYLGSYGINAAIEPRLQPEDRETYDAVLPHLNSDLEEAIRILVDWVEPESNAAFNFLLGSLYYMKERMDESEIELKLAIDKHPSFRRAHRTLALVYAQRDDVQKVIEHLLKVVALGGGDGQSYGMLGYGYLIEERYRSALGAYQNARVFAPDSFDYKRGEAQCLLNTRQYEQAVALYDELITDRPSNPEFWLLQANALLALDRREETAANLEMARCLGGETFENLSLLANIYMQDESIGLGAEVAASSMQYAEPGDADVAIRQLEYLTKGRYWEEASRLATAFEKWLEPKLEANQARMFASSRAAIDFGLGRDQVGIGVLEKVLEEDPLNGTSLLLLGKHYMDNEKYEESEYYYERVLSVESSRRDGLMALGQMEVARGDFKKALLYLRRAQEIEYETNTQQFLDQVEQASQSSR